jgi:hypothetical protein
MFAAWRCVGIWAERPAMNLDLIWATLGLIAVILAGAIVIAWANRWRRGLSNADTPATELEQYRALFEQGVLNKEEYERIRTRLEGISRPKADVAPTPGQAPEGPPMDGFREGSPGKSANP